MGGNHYHCALNISDNNQEESTDFNTFDCWLTNLFLQAERRSDWYFYGVLEPRELLCVKDNAALLKDCFDINDDVLTASVEGQLIQLHLFSTLVVQLVTSLVNPSSFRVTDLRLVRQGSFSSVTMLLLVKLWIIMLWEIMRVIMVSWNLPHSLHPFSGECGLRHLLPDHCYDDDDIKNDHGQTPRVSWW